MQTIFWKTSFFKENFCFVCLLYSFLEPNIFDNV